MVAAASKLLEAVADREDLKDEAELLGAIVLQDTDIDPGDGQPRIREGVAKDRIVSTTDPEM